MVHLFAVVHRGVVDRGSVVDGMVGGVVDNGDSVGDHLVVLLPAGLGVKGEGDLLAAGLSDDDLLLVNGVGGVDELGNVEALVLNLVLALDLGDGDVLGDAHLLGGRVGKTALDSKGSNDKGDLVGLGLVLVAHLVFAMVGVGSITVGRGLDSTGGDLHGLGLLVVGDLGGLAVSDDVLPLVDVGADLPLDNGVGLLTDGEDTVEAVVVVDHLLHRQGDRGHLLGKGGNAHLGVDGCVGVTAQKLGSVVDGVSNGVVSGMVDSMMLSTGKCDQGRKNEALEVEIISMNIIKLSGALSPAC